MSEVRTEKERSKNKLLGKLQDRLKYKKWISNESAVGDRFPPLFVNTKAHKDFSSFLHKRKSSSFNLFKFESEKSSNVDRKMNRESPSPDLFIKRRFKSSMFPSITLSLARERSVPVSKPSSDPMNFQNKYTFPKQLSITPAKKRQSRSRSDNQLIYESSNLANKVEQQEWASVSTKAINSQTSQPSTHHRVKSIENIWNAFISLHKPESPPLQVVKNETFGFDPRLNTKYNNDQKEPTTIEKIRKMRKRKSDLGTLGCPIIRYDTIRRKFDEILKRQSWDNKRLTLAVGQ